MQILINIRGTVFCLDIGRKTPWQAQIYLISFTELVYGNDGQVYGGNLIFGLFGEK